MLPDFIIIGAMKSGTSSLYHYIGCHPKITASIKKETDFFKTGSNFSKGVDWYLNQFHGEEVITFEASSNYTKRHIYPGVPERMHSLLPDIKLIYVLRDPIDRIISHYVHNYTKGEEDQSLSSILKKANNKYILTSKYYYQIQSFLEFYSENIVLFVDSKRLLIDTENVMDEIFNFLGISPYYDEELFSKRFHTSENKTRISKVEQLVNKTTSNIKIQTYARKILEPFRKRIKTPILSKEDKELIINALRDDCSKIRSFSGINFSHWNI